MCVPKPQAQAAPAAAPSLTTAPSLPSATGLELGAGRPSIANTLIGRLRLRSGGSASEGATNADASPGITSEGLATPGTPNTDLRFKGA